MLQRSHPVSIRSGNTQYYFNSTLLNNKGYYFKIKNIIQEIIPLFVLFFIKLSFFLENYNIYKYSNFIKKNKHNKSKLNFKLLLKNKKIWNKYYFFQNSKIFHQSSIYNYQKLMQDGSFETKHIKMKVRGLSNNINYFSNVRLYNISKNYILILQLCKSVNFFQKKTLKKSKNIFQILSKNNTLFFYVIFRKKPL